MQKEEITLTDEQIRVLCEAGVLILRDETTVVRNEEFSTDYLLSRDEKTDYFVSKKFGEYLNFLITEKLAGIQHTAPFELKGQIETSFRYKALTDEDKIAVLKELHAEEWSRFEKKYIEEAWQLSYLAEEDYFHQSLQSIVCAKLEEVICCIIFKPQVEGLFGPDEANWDHSLYEEMLPFIQQYAALSKVEFLKNQLSIYLNPENKEGELSEKEGANNLVLKQQILLLQSLGVFELQVIKDLPETQKGKLFGYLLNRNPKNTEDTIRYLDTPKSQVPKDINFVKTEKNLNKVAEILKEVGLNKK